MLQEVFAAAAAINSQQRHDAIFEWKKCLDLTNLLLSLGVSLESINEYIQSGKIPSNRPTQAKFSGEAFVKGNAQPLPVSSSCMVDVPNLDKGKQVAEKHHSNSGFCPVDYRSNLLSIGPSTTSHADAIVAKDADFSVGQKNLSSKSKNVVEEGEFLTPNSDPSPLPKPSWKAVVAQEQSRSKVPLAYYPPSLVDGVLTVKPPLEVLQRGMKLWHTSIISSFHHSRLPCSVVEPVVRKIWGATLGYKMLSSMTKDIMYSSLILKLPETLFFPVDLGTFTTSSWFFSSGRKGLTLPKISALKLQHGLSFIIFLSLTGLKRALATLLVELVSLYSLISMLILWFLSLLLVSVSKLMLELITLNLFL